MNYKLALIGFPVAHSLSPRMHNAALRALQLDGEYRALAVAPEQLEVTLHDLVTQRYRGVNVTTPHKQAVTAFMHELSNAARAIGAVNTIVIDDVRLIGHNTDALGFMRGLEQAHFDPAQRSVLVLGAGGAARAAMYALKQAGAQVFIWNRTRARAEQLAHKFGAVVCDDMNASVDLIVNTTSVGMTPHVEESAITLADRLDGTIVYDLVYNPRETKLLREARARGARTIGGIEMLIQQGAESFCLWTGRAAPLEIMRAAVAAV